MNLTDSEAPRGEMLSAVLDASIEEGVRKKELPPRKGRSDMAPKAFSDEGAVPMLRAIDPRIPLPYVITGFVVALFAVVSTYYQVQSMAESARDMKAAVSRLEQTVQALTSAQESLRYRLERLESERPHMGGGGQAR